MADDVFDTSRSCSVSIAKGIVSAQLLANAPACVHPIEAPQNVASGEN